MISVLMPTYNCGRYLKTAVSSILNQTYTDFEFLIIDDASTDNTEEIISGFSDSRIRYTKLKKVGLAAALNYGLHAASSTLVARMDADDIAHPRRFELQLKYLNDNPDIDILSCWSAYFSEDRILFNIKAPVNHDDIRAGLRLHSYLSHPGCIYKKNVILESGGYNGNVYEDYALWIKCIDKARFGNIPEILIFQRIREDSLSRSDRERKNTVYYNIQDELYKDLGYYFNLDRRNININFGWREYFFGEKSAARKYWAEDLELFRDIRIFTAFFLTYLPKKFLLRWNAANVRYKLEYLLNYFDNRNAEVRRIFKELIKE